jgi:hypothetical protein
MGHFNSGSNDMPELVRIRKRRRRRRMLPPAIIFFLCAGLLFLFGIFEQSAQSPRAASFIRTVPESHNFAEYSVPVEKDSLAERKVYPYSVVRGGVRSREELVEQIERDPVVAAHYSGFNASEAQIVRVRDEKLVYLSYRVDNNVFWTSRKIRLPQGEALISDGQNLARTRCGNRVSVKPQEPTSAEEPVPEVFNTPVLPVDTSLIDAETITTEPMYLTEELANPLSELAPPPDLLTLEDRFFYEEFLPYTPVTPFPFYFVEPEYPNEVPEPGSLLLLASGLTAAWGYGRWRSKKRPGALPE